MRIFGTREVGKKPSLLWARLSHFSFQHLISDDFHSSAPSHNLTFICKKDRIGRDGPDSSSDSLAMGRRTFVSLSDAVLEGRQDVGGGKDGDGDGEGVADL